MDDQLQLVRTIMEVVQGVGLWAVFLYLFIQERREHERTREMYREDLREIAGFKQHLSGLGRESREIKIVQPPD